MIECASALSAGAVVLKSWQQALRLETGTQVLVLQDARIRYHGCPSSTKNSHGHVFASDMRGAVARCIDRGPDEASERRELLFC